MRGIKKNLEKCTKKTIIVQIFSYIDLHKQFLILLIATINILSKIGLPLIYGFLIETVLTKKEEIFETFLKCIIIYLSLIFIESLTNFIQGYLVAKSNENVALNFRQKLYRKIYKLDFTEKNNYGMGNIISLYNSDIFQVTNFLSMFIYNVILQFLTLFIVLIAMFMISKLLSFIVILILPLFFLLFMKLGKKTQKGAKCRQETFVELNEILQEEIKGSSFLQMPFAIQYRKKKVNELFKKFFEKNFHFSILNQMVNCMGSFLASFSDWLVILVGGYLCIIKKLSIGGIIAFESYATHIFSPIISLVTLNQIWHTAKPSLERLFEFLNMPEGIENGKIEFKGTINHIEVQEVGFAYSGTKKILDRINFEITSNSLNVLMGNSGCGKSTMCTLLSKILIKSEGYILLNGQDISEYTPESLGTRLYYLPQDPLIYKGTIRENILLGEKFDDRYIKQALSKVCLTHIGHQKISLDFSVAPDGNNLSGGEKKRLVLARAIVRKFDVLILDEPTSGIDSYTCEKLKKLIKELAKKSIIILVSHDTNDIKSADQIIVLRNGEIVNRKDDQELKIDSYLKDVRSSE